ncbi:MAG: hypothetical protein PF439_07245 [Helicobacteraceae bacterium]|nr:hypothetical protein [Helicobacteraceae bacterium]
MELDKQTFGYLFGALVIIFLWLKFRNPYSGKNDRRKAKRRAGLKDRRVTLGRRMANQLQHESKLADRRHERSDRRVGAKTRRHKHRRKRDKGH